MKYLNVLFGIIATFICANVSAEPIDVAGTYTADISYTKQTPMASRRFFFGANPEIELTMKKKGNKLKGQLSGDREGDFKGKIDDEEITFEFYLKVRGDEIKDGAGTFIIQEDGKLEGDFKIRDSQKGIVRGFWTLTKNE